MSSYFRRQQRHHDMHIDELTIHNKKDLFNFNSIGEQLNFTMKYVQFNDKFRLYVDDDVLIFQKKVGENWVDKLRLS
jgi:hypothetical protein